MNLNIRKIKTKSIYKYTILSFLVLFLIIFVCFLIKELYYPVETKIEKPLYNYSVKPNVNYKVTLKPNTFFNDANMNEGKIYFSELIDNIKLHFNYEYNGDEESIINGNYNINGIMEGYIKNADEEIIIIWQKPFNLMQNDEFNFNHNQLFLNKEIDLDFQMYNLIAKEIIELTKTPAQVRLIFTMNVNLLTETKYGIVEDQSSPSLIIPLDVSMFEISKSGIEEKNEAIKQTITEVVPIDTNLIITLSILSLMCTLGLIFVLVFIQGVREDKLEKNIKKIFKNHGSRLVALVNCNYSDMENIYVVNNIEDLVKIADELEKPIFYKKRDQLKEIDNFYIVNDNNTYVYKLVKKNVENEEPSDNL